MLLGIYWQSIFFLWLSILASEAIVKSPTECPPFISKTSGDPSICTKITVESSSTSKRCWQCSIGDTSTKSNCTGNLVKCIVLHFNDTELFETFFPKYNIFVNNLFNVSGGQSGYNALHIATGHNNLTELNFRYLTSILGNQSKHYQHVTFNFGRPVRASQKLHVNNDSLLMNFTSINLHIVCNQNITIEYTVASNKISRKGPELCEISQQFHSNSTQVSTVRNTSRPIILRTSRTNKKPKPTPTRTSTTTRVTTTSLRTTTRERTTSLVPRTIETTESTTTTTKSMTTTKESTASRTSTTEATPTDSESMTVASGKITTVTSTKAGTEILLKSTTESVPIESTVASTPTTTTTVAEATIKTTLEIYTDQGSQFSESTTESSTKTVVITAQQTMPQDITKLTIIVASHTTTTTTSTIKEKTSLVRNSTKSSPSPPITITTTQTSRQNKTSFFLLLFGLVLIVICLILASLYLYLIYRRHKLRDEFGSDSATMSTMTTVDSSNILNSQSKPATTVSETFVSPMVEWTDDSDAQRQPMHRVTQTFDDDF